jgi:hypothetical protein
MCKGLLCWMFSCKCRCSKCCKHPSERNIAVGVAVGQNPRPAAIVRSNSVSVAALVALANRPLPPLGAPIHPSFSDGRPDAARGDERPDDVMRGDEFSDAAQGGDGHLPGMTSPTTTGLSPDDTTPAAQTTDPSTPEPPNADDAFIGAATRHLGPAKSPSTSVSHLSLARQPSSGAAAASTEARLPVRHFSFTAASAAAAGSAVASAAAGLPRRTSRSGMGATASKKGN